MTISYYKKGTVLDQGNENSLSSFKRAFPMLKAGVESGKQTAEKQVVEETPVLKRAKPASPSSDKQFRESLAHLELAWLNSKSSCWPG